MGILGKDTGYKLGKITQTLGKAFVGGGGLDSIGAGATSAGASSAASGAGQSLLSKGFSGAVGLGKSAMGVGGANAGGFDFKDALSAVSPKFARGMYMSSAADFRETQGALNTAKLDQIRFDNTLSDFDSALPEGVEDESREWLTERAQALGILQKNDKGVNQISNKDRKEAYATLLDTPAERIQLLQKQKLGIERRNTQNDALEQNAVEQMMIKANGTKDLVGVSPEELSRLNNEVMASISNGIADPKLMKQYQQAQRNRESINKNLSMHDTKLQQELAAQNTPVDAAKIAESNASTDLNIAKLGQIGVSTPLDIAKANKFNAEADAARASTQDAKVIAKIMTGSNQVTGGANEPVATQKLVDSPMAGDFNSGGGTLSKISDLESINQGLAAKNQQLATIPTTESIAQQKVNNATIKINQDLVKTLKIQEGKTTENAKRQAGRKSIDGLVDEMGALFRELERAGGLINKDRGGLDNAQIAAEASGLGQFIARHAPLVNPEGKNRLDLRDQVQILLPSMLLCIKESMGMGSKMLDSNRELNFYVSAAGDTGRSLASNAAALQTISNLYGTGKDLSEKFTEFGIKTTAVERERALLAKRLTVETNLHPTIGQWTPDKGKSGGTRTQEQKAEDIIKGN